MLSLPPFALREDPERSNCNETGKLKKTDKVEKRWPQTDCSLSPLWFIPTHPPDLQTTLSRSRGKKKPSRDIFLWIENAQSSTVSSLTLWEIGVRNGNRRSVMAGMVNRVSYLLLKQIMSQNEEKKETRKKPKERLWQIRHEHKSHYFSEKSYLCSVCYLSNVWTIWKGKEC